MGEVLAKNINISDSKKKIELYFSKKTDKLNENINEILKNM